MIEPHPRLKAKPCHSKSSHKAEVHDAWRQQLMRVENGHDFSIFWQLFGPRFMEWCNPHSGKTFSTLFSDEQANCNASLKHTQGHALSIQTDNSSDGHSFLPIQEFISEPGSSRECPSDLWMPRTQELPNIHMQWEVGHRVRTPGRQCASISSRSVWTLQQLPHSLPAQWGVSERPDLGIFQLKFTSVLGSFKTSHSSSSLKTLWHTDIDF